MYQWKVSDFLSVLIRSIRVHPRLILPGLSGPFLASVGELGGVEQRPEQVFVAGGLSGRCSKVVVGRGAFFFRGCSGKRS